MWPLTLKLDLTTPVFKSNMWHQNNNVTEESVCVRVFKKRIGEGGGGGQMTPPFFWRVILNFPI